MSDELSFPIPVVRRRGVPAPVPTALPNGKSWIYDKTNATGGGGTGPPPTPVLPNATLGTPIVVSSYAIDDMTRRFKQVTVPVSFPSGIGAGDRVRVYLLAPDTAIDTQEAFVGGPGGTETPGIVIGDAFSASKFVTRQDAEQKGEYPWDPTRPSVTFNHPAPVTPQRWRIIVVTANKTIENPLPTSPSVVTDVAPDGPDVSGREYAPLGLNFRLLDAAGEPTNGPQYIRQEGGGWLYRYSVAWDHDTTDPRYPSLGGYDIVVEYPDGRRELIASPSKTENRHDSDKWPVEPAPQKFTIWLVSWSDKGRNSIVPNLTPSVTFTVSVPIGSPGEEYAPNVTGFMYQSATYKTNASGQKVLVMTFIWTLPVDKTAFGGVVLDRKLPFEDWKSITGLVTGNTVTVEFDSYPAMEETWAFRAISQSPANKPNSYVPGVTPEFALNILPPATGTPPVTVLLASVYYDKDDLGSNVYGYSVTWQDPSRLSNPDYQGAKIYWSYSASGTGLQPLSGVNVGQMWKGGPWPLVEDLRGIWIYAVSVDVNGKEAVQGPATPHVGPLLISGQGGTIDPSKIPPIDLSMFPMDLEPVGIVNATPDAQGFLPGLAKTTTNVTNIGQTPHRLYQWNEAAGMYKIVGTALDIYADTITGSLIKASAITTIHMAGNTILVGPTPGGGIANRPPIIQVNNAAGGTVGFMGTYLGWEGIYGQAMRIGPTFGSSGDHSWVGIDASAAGVTIQNISLHIQDTQPGGSHSHVHTNPNTFDATYDSLTLTVADLNGHGNSRAATVSRGFVIWEGADPMGSGTVLGALVRHPTYRAGELSLSRMDPDIRTDCVLLSAYGDSTLPQVPLVRVGMSGTVRIDGRGYVGATGKISTDSGYWMFNFATEIVSSSGKFIGKGVEIQYPDTIYVTRSGMARTGMSYNAHICYAANLSNVTAIMQTHSSNANAGYFYLNNQSGALCIEGDPMSQGESLPYGVMRADGGFRVGGNKGRTIQVTVAKSGGGYYELYFAGGILTGVVSG